MTDVIISFDTEDFTSNVAATSIMEEAEILREEGVRGCFCVVGLLAKQLLAWRRDDVIEALSHHEVDIHTFSHTMHPTIDEITDIADFNKAYSEVLRQEKLAEELVKDVFGVEKIYASVPPGNEASYAVMYAYADMGIPIYAGTCCDTPDNAGAFYCNMYHMNYTASFEWNVMNRSEEEMREFIDKLAEKKHVIVYTHPNMSRFKNFWDGKNYKNGNLRKFGDWMECDRRTEQETQQFYNDIRKFLRLLKADDRFNFTTYAEMAERIKGERKITIEDIPAIRAEIGKELAPLSTPYSLSVSDIFLACRDMLLGKTEHICGKVYGFLDAPYAVESEVTLNAESIKKSAQEINADGFLPTEIMVGGKKIGPADWLRAALAVLCGEKEVTVRPDVAMPSLDPLPGVRDLKLRGTWMHSDSFEDKYLSDRLRLQAWTMRF